MKERLVKLGKILLIIFGVLFLIQILLFLALFSVTNWLDKVIKVKPDNSIKNIAPIIEYVNNYKMEHGVYPESIEGVKIKPDLYYNYETSNDGNCYKIKVKSKKDNSRHEYNKCLIENDDSKTETQSYVEIKN